MIRALKVMTVFTTGLAVFLFFLFSVICLLFGVGPLDPLLRTTKVLARAQSKEGLRFTLVQYWNGGDFYTTELWQQDADPQRQTRTVILDADDRKIWRCRLSLDEGRKIVQIVEGRRARGWYQWDSAVLTRLNGVEVVAVPEEPGELKRIFPEK